MPSESLAPNDPMAMLPFCGYNMGGCFRHWLAIGRRLTNALKIFHVNWFRIGEDGKFLCPGFGDNVRVLDWIIRCVEGRVAAHETAIGSVPTLLSLELDDLDLPRDRLRQLLAVEPRAWMNESTRYAAFLARFDDRLPQALWDEHEALRERLARDLIGQILV